MFEINRFFDGGVSEKTQSEKIEDAKKFLECGARSDGIENRQSTPYEEKKEWEPEGKFHQFCPSEKKENKTEESDADAEQLRKRNDCFIESNTEIL